MTLRTLRQTLQPLLSRIPCCRPPVLRRALQPDALLMTDLPAVTTAEHTDAFIREATASGWQVTCIGERLLLDCPVLPHPRVLRSACMADGEAGCCLFLLERHSGMASWSAEARALLKAAEEGNAALEKLFRAWHTDWAERLRLHRPLPEAALANLITDIITEEKHE